MSEKKLVELDELKNLNKAVVDFDKLSAKQKEHTLAKIRLGMEAIQRIQQRHLTDQKSYDSKIDFNSLPYEKRKEIIEKMQVETEQLRIRIQKSADKSLSEVPQIDPLRPIEEQIEEMKKIKAGMIHIREFLQKTEKKNG